MIGVLKDAGRRVTGGTLGRIANGHCKRRRLPYFKCVVKLV
jgi:hypothetical protein